MFAVRWFVVDQVDLFGKLVMMLYWCTPPGRVCDIPTLLDLISQSIWNYEVSLRIAEPPPFEGLQVLDEEAPIAGFLLMRWGLIGRPIERDHS